MTKTIDQLAQQLREAAQSGKTCPPLRDIIGLEDLQRAYAIQNQNIQQRVSEGAHIVGCKIGLTSKAVQKQLGVDQPDFGRLLNTMEVLNGDTIPFSELMQPKTEAEIAFVLSKDLDSSNITITDVISAIDYALVSIEIVGSRIENWNIKITDTIADNASASHYVLGHKPVRLENLDLLNCKMQMYKNGELVSEGVGAACLGSPINATLWLAKTMADLGQPLKAGQVILSGALGPMVAAEPGDDIKAVIEGLGEVRVKFGDL
jgi:2-keto-4-pentenoate hydratase